ncbi:MAG: hypothetical protein ACR2KQ_09975 [Actinomycetota bacterium]
MRKSALRMAGIVLAVAVVATAATALSKSDGSTSDREQQRRATSDQSLPVRNFHGLYYHTAENIRGLANSAVAVVHAEATASNQEPGEDPDLVYTHQEFRTIEVFRGEVGPEFTVFLTGGVVEEGPNGPYLLEDAENPQYERGSNYFLVLAQHPSIPHEYVAIGPSQGRYEIVNERLQALPAAKKFAIESRFDRITIRQAVDLLKDSRP